MNLDWRFWLRLKSIATATLGIIGMDDDINSVLVRTSYCRLRDLWLSFINMHIWVSENCFMLPLCRLSTFSSNFRYLQISDLQTHSPLWAYKLIRIHVIINGYNMTFIQIIVPTSRLMVTSKRNIWYHIWAFIFNWEPIIILCTLRPLSIALACIPYWDIQCRSYTVVYHHHPYRNVYFFWCKLWEPRNK